MRLRYFGQFIIGSDEGEALGLRWPDIDFEEGTVMIQNQRTRVAHDIEKKPKSESSVRELPFNITNRRIPKGPESQAIREQTVVRRPINNK